MSSNVGRYTPVAGTPVSVDTGTPWEYIRIINSSPYALSLSLGGQGTIDFPEMYLEDIKIERSYNGKLNFTPFSNIPNPAAALTNYVSINVYQPGEIRQPQAQPLTTMSNVGNSVPLNANATSVTNDGNALTTFIEATLTGHSSSDVRIKNNGSAGFNNSVEAINFVSFQNGVGKPVGLFGYDGTNNNLSITLNTDGSFTGQFGIAQGGFGRFNGAASGTYNHGYGATPSWFGPMQMVVGSQTMGYDTVTGTQVHITSGSGNSFSCLCTKL